MKPSPIIRCSQTTGSLTTCLLLLATTAQAATTITFDDLALPAPNTYWDGADGSGGFDSHGIHFNNDYDDTWGSWSGFAYSSVDDPITAGWLNQYAVANGTGYGGTGQYAVAYDLAQSDTITLPQPSRVDGFLINNTTYTALSMQDGDAFAKQFGGLDGSDPDWFLLTITGLDGNDQVLGTHEVYLADYRFTDPAQDYILRDWTPVDLTGLGAEVQKLEFSLSSSDAGGGFMNTPAYFAMDNFTVAQVPEPSSLALLGLGAWFLWHRRPRSPRRRTSAAHPNSRVL